MIAARARVLLAIASITIREASRRKLMLALLLVTLLVILATSWLFSRIPSLCGDNSCSTRLDTPAVRVLTSQLLILVMFVFSFVLALSAVFMTAPAISGEIESGVVLAVLTRPLSRTDYLVGKWLGLSALVVLYIGGASLVEFELVNIGTGYFPPHPFMFAAFLAGQTIVILTLAMLVSTRMAAMAGGIISLGAFGASWMAGIGGNLGVAFQNQGIINVANLLKLALPSDGLWRGAIYSLEPMAFIAASQSNTGAGRGMATLPFFAATPPPLSYLAWSVAWIVGVLALAVWSFRRREI
jgi:ABC-type transport system involved in multi-copper enzyme maturation permease subunit